MFAILLLAAPTAHLWLGGDVELGHGGQAVLAQLAPAVQHSTGVVNLEGAVATAPTSGPGPRLVNDPAALGELKAAGIAVVGIANNHSDDAGPKGAASSARALRALGLLPAGGPAGPAILERGGLRIAISAHDLTGGVPANLVDELAAARSRADVLIATFHVTVEPRYLPPPELKRAVEIALAAGALVVAAHGSHEIGPVERRGKAVIAWGLGNLAFECDCTKESEGLLLEVSLGREGVTRAEVVPIAAGLGGAAARLGAPGPLLELLQALGSSPLRLDRDRLGF